MKSLFTLTEKRRDQLHNMLWGGCWGVIIVGLPGVIFLFYISMAAAHAKDLGTHGRVYDIVEVDLLGVINARAQDELDSGRWDARVDEWREQAKSQAARPRGIHLPRATRPHSYLWDPSAVSPNDIRDASGKIIIPAGTSVNPLDYISLTRNLVFVDGDDDKQIAWVLNATANNRDHYKIILTNGPILDLMEEHQVRLYFDQHQSLTRKMAIQRLPAVVFQENKLLRIREIALP